MSGFMSKSFRHDCNRHGCLQETLPSWDWMRGCFPRGIMPTDVDGMVEIGGSVLFIEQKREGASLTPGQREAFRVLSSKPDVSVLFLRGPLADCRYEYLFYGKGPANGWQRGTTDDLRQILTAWAEVVDEPNEAA